jgi:hypothetical protein
MRWALKQRMDFIRERLRFVGTINRGDIVLKFGVSVPQASLDLSAFRKLHPDAMRYDLTRKTFVSTAPVETPTRDINVAAMALANADDEYLTTVVQRDPSMIRDVAAALIYERTR